VVLDLDDTLFDTASRSLRIVRDFARGKVEQGAEHWEPATRMGKAVIGWNIRDQLPRYVSAPEREWQELEAYWKARFFGGVDCAYDLVIPGATRYVQDLSAAGAHLVYLTGRPGASMGNCTRIALREKGFPMSSLSTTLILKEDATERDVDFKARAFAKIRMMGEVVAGFENDPANLNRFGEAFPGAARVFLDTRKAPNSPELIGDVHVVRNYRSR
jgi:hypothetical protein